MCKPSPVLPEWQTAEHAKGAWTQTPLDSAAKRLLVQPALNVRRTCPMHGDVDAGDGFCEPGFSTERGFEPRITLGCSPIPPDFRRVAELMCMPIHHDVEAARRVLQDGAS